MTTTEAFETWYLEQVGITLAEAKQRGVADLSLLQSCYQAATERAAKQCENEAEHVLPFEEAEGARWCAAAIRAREDGVAGGANNGKA